MELKKNYTWISLATLFIVVCSISLYAIFYTPFTPIVPPTYTINAVATIGGTITPTGISIINEAGSQTYTFRANPGYKIASVIIDNASTTATSSYTFNNLTQNHSIKATFVPTYYTSNKHGIYFKEQIAPGVDPKTFMVLGDYYAKDRRGVFYSTGERIPSADPASFQVLIDHPAYAIDNEYVFWASTQIYGADVGTFKVLGESYATDKTNVYYTDQIVTKADLKTFAYKGNGYAQDKNNIYHLGQVFTLSKQVPQQIGFTYAKNADGVFYNGDEITGADIESFTALSSYYAKDKNRVYYQWTPLGDAATSSFEVISTGITGPNVARDANVVYSEFTPLPLNPKTVRVIGDNFLADDAAVYFTHDEVIGADPSTFKFLGFNYGVDKSGLWSGTQFITNRTSKLGEKSSLNKYRYLGDSFITDGINVYLGTNVLVGANPATFDYIEGSPVSYDTDSLFYGNETIAVNSKDLSIFGARAAYVKTSTEVFFRGSKIEGADVVTFTVSDDENYASDKTGKYYNGERISEGIYEPNLVENVPESRY